MGFCRLPEPDHGRVAGARDRYGEYLSAWRRNAALPSRRARLSDREGNQERHHGGGEDFTLLGRTHVDRTELGDRQFVLHNVGRVAARSTSPPGLRLHSGVTRGAFAHDRRYRWEGNRASSLGTPVRRLARPRMHGRTNSDLDNAGFGRQQYSFAARGYNALCARQSGERSRWRIRRGTADPDPRFGGYAERLLTPTDQTTSRTLSFNTVFRIAQPSFWPRRSASLNLRNWSVLTLPGIGGSLGSTTACTTAGPSCVSARRRVSSASSACSIVNPAAPQLMATPAKSMGWSSTPNSGFPSNTICSHLIWPSALFLITITFTFRWYFTRVASSPISMVTPPSPTIQTTCRFG